MLRIIEEASAALARQAGLHRPALSPAASLALRAGQARDKRGCTAATQRSFQRRVPPQDEPPGDGSFGVAVEPRQRLVLRVLREDAVGGLVQETESLESLTILERPSHAPC